MLLIIMCALLCGMTRSGFNYPLTMPDPLSAHIDIFTNIFPFIREYETPIQIRLVSIIDEAFWNCLAIYHPTALDSITKQRPRIAVHPQIIANNGTAETRMLCGTYAYGIIYDYLLPQATDSNEALLNSFGLNIAYITLNPDVAACNIDDVNCLQNVALQNNFTPEIMASIVAYEIIHYLSNDGWNGDGDIGTNGGVCTANCRPYKDTTGYKPKGSIWNKRWEPLIEDNGKGFFYNYDHVVPHIGKTAKLKVISCYELKSRTAPDPQYNYKVETELVLDRLTDLANNDTQKLLVEFFDDKLSVAVAVGVSVEALLGWTFEERLFFLTGISAAEYDTMIQAWREKRKWDLVRPTTLIKRDKNNKIITYGGPYQGVKQIRSRDFESYIRVMPHSEYPSASECICLCIAQYTDKYLKDRHGITGSTSITIPLPGEFFAAGSSKIEPGSTPSNDLHITLNDLTELSDLCGESRLWGGMHFTAAIDGAYQLCDGIGQSGYDFAVSLLNGSPL